jgi:pimeloyl-ACP methyl ester carboxylesterase
MNRAGTLILVLCVYLTSTQAQAPPRQILPISHVPRKPAFAQNPQILHGAAPKLPASATPDAIPATCPPGAVGAVCGYVKVPLDREHPARVKISIYFELYPHSGAGTAESAILANFGGPGVSTTLNRGFAQFLFGPNLDVHDLLLIDDRGTGLSTAIDCKELQHGTEAFGESETDCAEQLGVAASRYGDGDIAKDVDAVRAALGYDLVDYHGGSYGGADVTAYATRFGEHLRSIILDAPYGTPALEPFAIEHYRTDVDPRLVQLDCSRSPTCSADHPDPVAAFDELVKAIRHHEVQGDAHDAAGNLVHVHLDENALLNFVTHNVLGNFTNIGELLAAGSSLERGDSAPLLRLGAEGFFTLVGDSGDPTIISSGAFYATGCVNAEQPWDWSEPLSERKEHYEEAVSDLPQDFFAPYSKAAATNLLFSHLGRECLWWQKPEPSSPVAPDHAIYPHVPTLVLQGDIDNVVPPEETAKVVALFPNSTPVTVVEAGHETVFWTQCARNLVPEFIETLRVADTSCAATPEIVWPAVGRFPLLANDARPAEVNSNGANQIGLAERKVVTVSVAAATDALQRSFIGPGDGVGLRAGTFHTNFGATGWTTTLTGCAFATDVTVSGTITWGFGGDNSFVADMVVSGPGTGGGTLHVEGFWQAPGPVGNLSVSGMLGGRQVAVLVPEA